MSSSNRIAREKSARRRDSRRVTAGSRSARRRQNVRSFEGLRLKTLASAGGTAGTVTSWPSTQRSARTASARSRGSRDLQRLRRDAVAHRRRPRRGPTGGGIPGLLEELARRYGVVAVVSGRPGAFLAAHLPASILLVGLYGLEVQRHGQRQIMPEAERWRPVVSAAAACIRAAAPSGVLVEPKGLSVTCHYRADPSLEAQVTALAQEVVAATALVARAGRKSVELLPPTHADKGMVPGNGPRTCTLPAISVTISAMCRPSAPSTIWPPGGSPRHGSRCAAMRRPGNCCKLRT